MTNMALRWPGTGLSAASQLWTCAIIHFVRPFLHRKKKSPNRIVCMALSSGEKREQTKQAQPLRGQHPEPVESGMEKSQAPSDALSTRRERVGFAPQGRERKALLLSCLEDTAQSSCRTKLRTWQERIKNVASQGKIKKKKNYTVPSCGEEREHAFQS